MAWKLLIWISFAILGSTYFGYLLLSQITSWNDHSRIAFKGNERTTEIDYPAITFCTRTNSKYAIIERIGNTLSLDSEFTKKHILPIRNAIIEKDLNEDSSEAKKLYDDECIGNDYYVYKKVDCKVQKENFVLNILFLLLHLKLVLPDFPALKCYPQTLNMFYQ